jgi:hypothetical protein
MGCTGNALATGIDAPLEPKVSPIRIRSQLSAEVLGMAKKPSLYVRRTLYFSEEKGRGQEIYSHLYELGLALTYPGIVGQKWI